MKLKIKKIKFLAGRPVCIIHEKTAKSMSLHVGNRVSISKKGKKIVSIVDTASGIISQKEISVSESIIKTLGLKNKDIVEVKIIKRPLSIKLIKKKLNGETLDKKEIREIIKNIANNSLTEVEIAFFISAVYNKGMSLKETKYLTRAMVDMGNTIKLRGRIFDKHSIGGVAGNRTTPIVVSICAAAGLKMPKTSSRAITSAAGTADVIEAITRVDFSIPEIKKIVKKTGACFVWGGALGLAPTDDKIIKIERIVNIDSTPQLLASILSKKISVGSKYILIDIPYGKSAKVSKSQAEKLKKSFLRIGKEFDLSLDVILTDGSEPIGKGIGPVLEVKDILKVLTREDSPKDLEEKSLILSGRLLELSGIKNGYKKAKEILESKKALKKFIEIIEAQEGDTKKLNKFKNPEFSFKIKSKKKGKIKHLDNKLVNGLARNLGCPEDKLAGIYLNKKKGDAIKKGEVIMTLYATSNEKLSNSKKFYKNNKEIIELV